MFDYDYDRAAIITELGIESSDAEFKTHVLERIDKLLSERMASRMLATLPPEELERFNGFTKKQDAEDYLKQRYPNYLEMYEEELQDIISLLKAAMPTE